MSSCIMRTWICKSESTPMSQHYYGLDVDLSYLQTTSISMWYNQPVCCSWSAGKNNRERPLSPLLFIYHVFLLLFHFVFSWELLRYKWIARFFSHSQYTPLSLFSDLGQLVILCIHGELCAAGFVVMTAGCFGCVGWKQSKHRWIKQRKRCLTSWCHK